MSLPPTTHARPPLPGDAAAQANAVPLRERSMMVVLKEQIRLQNERAALMRAVGLDPDTDTVTDAIAIIEALCAHYEATTG